MRQSSYLSRIEHIILVLVFLIPVMYTFAHFGAPYAGFLWDPRDGTVSEIFIEPATDPTLQVGDKLIQVGPVTWPEFATNLRQTFFDRAQTNETIPVVVERDGKRVFIQWVFPGLTTTEFLARLVSGWWLSYIFWGMALLTWLTARPKDVRWWLLIAFNLLTAIWLSTGGPSRRHTWESAIALRSAIWLSVPVYWHLHWVFPKPLRRLPNRVWGFFYTPWVLLSLAEWFFLPAFPVSISQLALALALTGSIILLLTHAIYQPAHRRDVALLVVTAVASVLPTVGVGIAAASSLPSAYVQGGSLITLLALPLAYFYIAYRRHIAGLDVRVNPLITPYLYATVLGMGALIFVLLGEFWLRFPGATILIGISTALVAALITVYSYNPFRRFVERYLLGIPITPTRLLHTYAARITTSLTLPGLVRLLTDEILPTLLVRQSVLLRCDEEENGRYQIRLLHQLGVDSSDVPSDREIPTLLNQVRRYRPVSTQSMPCPWAGLILPLTLGQSTFGLWLLGQRDPDDFYAVGEIPTLQALADQTAIALVNIEQAKRLEALHRANVERHESERMRLAHELHDEVLNQLTVLMMKVDEHSLAPGFKASYQALTQRIRDIVSDLRPAMLQYGLSLALEELVDQWTERKVDGPSIEYQVPMSSTRYRPDVEEYVYRMIQQAVENALRHARAQAIRIYGSLNPEMIDLSVEDDGVGFVIDSGRLDVNELLAHKHFGLVGIYERAAAIGAEVYLKSVPEHGTQVHVIWKPTGSSSDSFQVLSQGQLSL